MVNNHPLAALASRKLSKDFQARKKAKENQPKLDTKAEKEAKLNALLDKIRREGMESLSQKERTLLERLKNDL